MRMDEVPTEILATLSPQVRAEVEALTEDQRAWLVADERLWRKAKAIAEREKVDASGVYHVLRNLQKTPTERLRAGLQHGRAFRLHRR